ncbi:MAG TPA: FAD-dependent oxidoreductase [Candidatus Acidoferrales bacterium]|jgi:D-amino-acid dehydrogenase|nr:FAD-dependent oxidoreductase [Candidatus Acidoferrales bacterium]
MTMKVEALVIGGGSIGVCSAYSLSSKGKQVTVVDQGLVGAGCSYGNAGVVAASHIVPLAAPGVLLQGLRWLFDPDGPFYIKPRLDPQLALWLWRFAMACRQKPTLRGTSLLSELTRASLPLFRELANTDGVGFYFREKGSLTLYRNPGQFQADVKATQMLKGYGIDSTILDRNGVRGFEPRVSSQVVGGIHFPGDAHLNPSKFVTRLACHAQKLGARFLSQTEVVDFETRDGKIRKVKTTRGDFEPDDVVLAAGSWSGQLAKRLKLSLSIQPAKGYSLTFKCSGLDECPPFNLSEAKVIVTPMGNTLRFAGTLELAGLDFSVNQGRARAVQSAVGNYLSGMEHLELLEIWRGLRPLTPDGLPIIERSRTWENLIIATGHGMQGIALGPITGKLVSELACRETPSIKIEGLGERRFR